jgi:hypothetical protein
MENGEFSAHYRIGMRTFPAVGTGLRGSRWCASSGLLSCLQWPEVSDPQRQLASELCVESKCLYRKEVWCVVPSSLQERSANRHELTPRAVCPRIDQTPSV